MKFNPTLYFITDSTGCSESTLLGTIAAACAGGATMVQLREKECSGTVYWERAKKVKEITDSYGVPLIIDDRADIALACDAAGVHVGTDDLPVAQARRIMGPDKIVGATAKTAQRALEAQREGADYLGVGAIYPTATKQTIRTTVEDLKTICQAVTIPVCAIGGLTAENCGILAGSGIRGLCVVSAIMKSRQPEQAAAALRMKADQLIR